MGVSPNPKRASRERKVWLAIDELQSKQWWRRSGVSCQTECAMKLLGLDHADIRVRSIAVVETFYDTLLPTLGLPRKSEAHVGANGEWYGVEASRPRNVIEYHTPIESGSPGWFVGFIEDPTSAPTATRIAFTLADEADLPAIEQLLRAAGARVVEWSSEANYPAIFFEDPGGTRLEICARRPRA